MIKRGFDFVITIGAKRTRANALSEMLIRSGADDVRIRDIKGKIRVEAKARRMLTEEQLASILTN